MARKHAGRHRAPGFSPITEIADIAAQTASPAMKASAVVVASGGLLATFALPASAAPLDNGTAVAAAAQPLVAQPAVAVSAVGAVAVAAPSKPANAPTFGVIGFTGKASTPDAAPAMKIKKVVQAAPATATRVSRSATRTATAATAAVSAAPAAKAISLPAPSGGILGAAAALSGIPYVYGGISTSGADCSGYTSLVFRAIGKSIPRTAEGQREAATPVSNPVPGDLVFFGFPAYHVGIYAGGGMLYDNQRPGSTSGLHSIWTTRNVSYGRL